jgi:hypothetical protein
MTRSVTRAVEASCALVGAVLAVRLLGLERLGAMLARIPAHETVGPFDSRAREHADALARVARWLPVPPRCLPQCLALCWMLRRRGMAVELVIGVCKFPFTAHAWVESGGAVVEWQAGLGVQSGYSLVDALAVIYRSGMDASAAAATRASTRPTASLPVDRVGSRQRFMKGSMRRS